MTLDPRLEKLIQRYLSTLQHGLEDLEPEHREEILHGFETHIVDLIERGEGKHAVEDILEELGAPSGIAQLYLQN